MEGTLDILWPNLLAVAVAVAVFAYPSIVMSKRLKNAGVRLGDTTVDAAVAANFHATTKAAGRKTALWFFLISLVAAAVGTTIAALITAAIEPRADLETGMMVFALFYGIGYLGSVICLAFTVAAAMRIRAAQKYLVRQMEAYPRSPVIAEVAESLRVSRGATGVYAVSVLAVIGSIVAGLVYVAFLFLAAQWAIDCARNSKCI